MRRRPLLAVTAATWAVITTVITTAAAWGTGTAVAAPADTNPVPPVVSTIDGIWNQHVPPDAFGLLGPTDAFGRFVEPFVPTTTELRDFFGRLQQFRPPAPINPATG